MVNKVVYLWPETRMGMA